MSFRCHDLHAYKTADAGAHAFKASQPFISKFDLGPSALCHMAMPGMDMSALIIIGTLIQLMH